MDQIMRLDEITTDNGYSDLKMWGIQPLIAMVNHLCFAIEPGTPPDQNSVRLINHVGERLEDIAEVLDRLDSERG